MEIIRKTKVQETQNWAWTGNWQVFFLEHTYMSWMNEWMNKLVFLIVATLRKTESDPVDFTWAAPTIKPLFLP